MTEILRSLSIAWSLFHILILFMSLYRSRFSRRKTFLLTGIFMGMLIVINVAGLLLLGYERMGQLFILTCTLPSLLFFWLMSKDHGGRFLFTFCLSDTFSYWIIIITNLLDFYLGGGRAVLMLLLRLAAFPLAEYLAWRYLRDLYRTLQEQVKKGWLIASCLGAIYYLLMVLSSSFPTIITSRPVYLPPFVLILVLMPLTYASILFALHQQLTAFRTEEQNRMLSIQKEQLDAKMENYEATRRIHHDIQAFGTTLLGLLADKQYEEATCLVSNINQRIESAPISYCYDPYINAVLNQYRTRFESASVSLKITVQAGSDPLPGMKLSLILSNALENSLRAVCSLPVPQRGASVQIRQRNAYLLLRVRNACDPLLTIPETGIPASTKQESGHGYGLPTIFQTAESLGGGASCYVRDGQFILDVNVRSGTES